ncbi:MAG: hypothetical protein CMF43_04295 [Legionellales bacterium]|nr:hypothetical protein [Legionellales bacterium]
MVYSMPNPSITDSEQQHLATLAQHYAQSPGASTREALQTYIVALCYRHRHSEGSHSGGKSGSLALNINPDPKKNAIAHAQHELFNHLINLVNHTLKESSPRSLMSLSSPQFTWQGTTTYQIKKDSSQVIQKGFFAPRVIQREELNDNTAELLVDCISETLNDDQSPIVSAMHPTSICFDDTDGQSIIASQYLPDTINTLSGFIGSSIAALKTVDDHLIREHKLDIDLEGLRKKYASFELDAEDEIAIVDKIPERIGVLSDTAGIKRENMIERNDLNTLASIYALSHQNDPSGQRLSLHQPILEGLLDELSFSHLIADHDVNPGNFIIRHHDHELQVCRIDFGMANYHFTRGRIFGFSRRPFENLFFDIPKESFQDFICRKKIGFGIHTFLNPFLVASKTFKHLQGIKALFQKPSMDEMVLTQDICHRNIEMHDYLASPTTHRQLINRFMSKIDNLPTQNKLDILRDLKLMELQSIRTAYLNFQPGFRLSSTLKLLGMVSTTPLFMISRFLVSPFSLAFRFRNPVPLTTWTFIQEQALNETMRVAESDPHLADREISGCVERLLTNIALDNKPQLSPDALTQVTREHIAANRLVMSSGAGKFIRKPTRKAPHGKQTQDPSRQTRH